MTCQEVQSNVIKYVNNQLDIKTLESFVEHVEGCADCMEELEVYYILLVGMKRLDQDKNESLNFHADFTQSLEHAKIRIIKYKHQCIRRRILFVLVIIFMMLASGFSMNHKIEKGNRPYREEGEHSYRLPIPFFEERIKQTDDNFREKVDKLKNGTKIDRSNQ